MTTTDQIEIPRHLDEVPRMLTQLMTVFSGHAEECAAKADEHKEMQSLAAAVTTASFLAGSAMLTNGVVPLLRHVHDAMITHLENEANEQAAADIEPFYEPDECVARAKSVLGGLAEQLTPGSQWLLFGDRIVTIVDVADDGDITYAEPNSEENSNPVPLVTFLGCCTPLIELSS